VSHDPTEIIIIWCSRNIYDYYPCWKQFFYIFILIESSKEQNWSEMESFCNIQKFGVSKNLFCIFENTFIHQGWVKLIKSYSKDIINVRKDYILNKCCSSELSIHRRIFWGKKWYTTVFNIENNNLFFEHKISLLEWFLKDHVTLKTDV